MTTDHDTFQHQSKTVSLFPHQDVYVSLHHLFQVQDKCRRIFYIIFPLIGEPSHCCTVDNSVVGWPTDIDNVNSNDFILVIEMRHFLQHTNHNHIIINVKINVALSENASRTRYTIKIKLKLGKWVLEQKKNLCLTLCSMTSSEYNTQRHLKTSLFQQVHQ